jgi:cytochrome b subunit of formate dehydrogenase
VDLRRLRHGEWIAGISGVVLFVALFLDWYKVRNSADAQFAGDTSANAWQVFAAVDIFLAAAALFGIALAAGAATQRSAAVPQAIGALTVPVAFIAAILVVIRLIDLPGWESVFQNGEGVYLNSNLGGPQVGREIGLYIGVVATLGVLIGAWRSIGDQRFPKGASAQVEVTPLPAPKPRDEPAGET